MKDAMKADIDYFVSTIFTNRLDTSHPWGRDATVTEGCLRMLKQMSVSFEDWFLVFLMVCNLENTNCDS